MRIMPIPPSVEAETRTQAKWLTTALCHAADRVIGEHAAQPGRLALEEIAESLRHLHLIMLEVACGHAGLDKAEAQRFLLADGTRYPPFCRPRGFGQARSHTLPACGGQSLPAVDPPAPPWPLVHMGA